MNLIATDKDTFRRVLSLTRRFCRPPIDCESLTQDIILEATTNNLPITFLTVKHRCFDCLRAYRTLTDHEKAYAMLDKTQPCVVEYTELDLLLVETQLTSNERTVILLYFAHELTLKEIARSLNLTVRQVSDLQWSGLERLKETARRIYG